MTERGGCWSRRLAVFGLLAGVTVAQAATTIYSCTDASGKKLTSDRPIAECANRDQRVLNADGSVSQACVDGVDAANTNLATPALEEK